MVTQPSARDYFHAILKIRQTFFRGYPLFLLATIALPGRVPPKRGLPRWVHSRILCTLRTRDGRSFRCYLSELWPVMEAFGYESYRDPGIDYGSAKVIVDAGANVGAAAAWMSTQAGDAFILAIEPDPEVAERLTDNLGRFRIDNRTVVLRAAVGEGPGWAVLQKEVTSSILTSVRSIDDGDLPDRVPVVGLKEILGLTPIDSIDVLKTDCEGGEFRLFGGADASDITKVKSVVGEYHLNRGDVASLARDLGRGGLHFQVIDEHENDGTFRALRQP